MRICVTVWVLLILLYASAFSQPDSASVDLYNKVHNSMNTDSLNGIPDSLNLIKPLPAQRSGIDTVVYYQANDTIVFDARKKMMRLTGDGEIKYKSQQLNSNIITIDFDNNTMDALAEKDTAGIYQGFPKFKDGSEEFVGEHIKYNFKTQKGSVSLGETQVQNGFYFGEKIKRVSPAQLYVKNGRYTTCDDPNPHYYFGSPEMLVIPDHAVYMDPLIFYIEDMPVFILPTGLFFTFQKGRSSGILIPKFFFSGSRGVVFQDLGYYWAASEYWDTKLTTDIYSKGGYLLKNYTQWKLTNQFSGNLNLKYGNVRLSVDDPWTQTWDFGLSHHEDFTPTDKVDINLHFASSNFNKLTSTDLMQIVQQNANSNASYTHNFDNSTLSASYSRDENIITNEYSQSFPLRYNFPTVKIFNSVSGIPDWMKQITFTYNFNTLYSNSYSRNITINAVDSTKYDTSYTSRYKALITHSPSISISPKFGRFTLSPSIGMSAQNYFRKVHKTFNPIDSSITDSTENGFYTEYNVNFGLRASTTIYGIADDSKPFMGFIKPSSLGIKAFRHVYVPNLSFNVTPDQSGASDGFYGTVFDTTLKKSVLYSYFELDGGGIASRAFSGKLTYSDKNSFEIKLPGKDTIPDKNVSLLTINNSISYDFAADSMNFSDINVGFNNSELSFLSLNGSLGLTLYDDAKVFRDSVNYTNVKVNKFLFHTGKFFTRLTNFQLSLSTNFGSEGINLNDNGLNQPDTTSQPKDSVSLGKRFLNRQNSKVKDLDLFGDSTPGYSPVSIPWNLQLGLTYRYDAPYSDPNSKTETLNLSANLAFTVANNWKISTQTQYSFDSHEIVTPIINITRQLHEWSMSFVWYPIGPSQGFHFQIALNDDTLKDLKYEKQNSAIIR